MTTLVLPLLYLVHLSMTNDCDNERHLNTTDYITSYDNPNLPFCIGSYLDPALIKLICPLCSVTVGDKLYR